ncbi:MAG TPA: hypothetical protein VGB37_14070, partial [Candidatus Lokiarchaeia archaeon]
ISTKEFTKMSTLKANRKLFLFVKIALIRIIKINYRLSKYGKDSIVLYCNASLISIRRVYF